MTRARSLAFLREQAGHLEEQARRSRDLLLVAMARLPERRAWLAPWADRAAVLDLAERVERLERERLAVEADLERLSQDRRTTRS